MVVWLTTEGIRVVVEPTTEGIKMIVWLTTEGTRVVGPTAEGIRVVVSTTGLGIGTLIDTGLGDCGFTIELDGESGTADVIGLTDTGAADELGVLTGATVLEGEPGLEAMVVPGTTGGGITILEGGENKMVVPGGGLTVVEDGEDSMVVGDDGEELAATGSGCSPCSEPLE